LSPHFAFSVYLTFSFHSSNKDLSARPLQPKLLIKPDTNGPQMRHGEHSTANSVRQNRLSTVNSKITEFIAMIRNVICATFMFALLALISNSTVSLKAAERAEKQNNLFHNYYVPPAGYHSVGAELYPCPRPTPQYVGQTYITYPAFMPHEFLYPHHRSYNVKHPDGQTTNVSVSWY
jgi:hypothetical protein